MRPLFVGTWIMLGISIGAAAEAVAQPLMPVDQIPVPPARVVQTALPLASPTTSPTTAPSVYTAPRGAAAGARIVVLPFEALGDAAHRDWVGRAIQESLSGEVARLRDLSPVSATAPAEQIDTDAARAIAKANGGDIVVFGATQFDGSDIRLTGEVVNVASGSALAGLKASGDFRDLFSLEDQLSTQLGRALRPPPPAAANAPSVAQQDEAIFGRPVPNLTTDELYSAPGNTASYADEYNRYNYDWGGLQPYYYPGYSYYGGTYIGVGGYGGLNGYGYYGHYTGHREGRGHHGR